jgi:serine/threonine-protein kinase
MLEAREVLRRTERGELRGGEPRWADVTNDDPWYDGRSPLHGFTIVDSPRRGTVIDVAEVIDLALHTDAWIPLGRQTRHRFCPACHAIGRPSDRFCVKDRNQLVPAMIGGRFEIMGLIDQGGMGVVYHVRDVTISREYALKVIRQDRAPDARTHRRFLRETRLANAMDHPNLMSIVHIDADPTVGVYMVSEYIEGITLAEDIHWCFERIGEYPPGRLRSVASQICQGLEAMHSAGVVHRDLKPGNIMLAGIKGQKVSPDPRVKLLDFGLAILETPSATTITEAGKIMGTPGFLSPEQGLRKRAARRSDIYALGSILYQMLTGSRPYQPLRGLEAVIAQREGPPPPVRKAAPGAAVGKKLDTYVMKMLHPDPRKRPPSVRDVRETLDRLTVDL